MTPLEKVYAEWLALQPVDAQTQYRIEQRFAIDFNYNSNHIEGNTLTYGQTEQLLLFGKVTGEATMKDCEEMKASFVCQKMMVAEASIKDKPLTQNFIRQLHQTLLREDYEVHYSLPGGESVAYTVHAGRYKTRPNSVITRNGMHFEYASPEETPVLMTDLVDWYNRAEQEKSMAPPELAALFHYRYIRIHPFEDGNGRMARLLVNYILLRHGYPMVVVRSRRKQEYLDALEASDKVVGPVPSKGACATLREIRHFFNYFTKLLREEMTVAVQFATIRDEQIWWYDGEMVRFRTATTGKILSTIMDEAGITTEELAKRVGVSLAAVNKQLKSLTEKQYIRRKENGEWLVVIYPSV